MHRSTDNPNPALCQKHPGLRTAESIAVKASTWVTFAVLQLLLVSVAGAYGWHRYQTITAARLAPEPSLEPITIGPLYDRPDLVSDEQLRAVLTRLQPRLRGPQPAINHVDHALRFWGLTSHFEDDACLSGVEMRDLLLDHRAFRNAWGDKAKPFLIADTRGDTERLILRTRRGQATASHVDHSLAGLAEVGTPLDYPVITPIGELPLRAAFDQAFAEFSLNQDEYEWSTMVFLHYLSGQKSWFTTEGQLVTWDRLAERLMRQRLAQGVCFGQHRLYTLALMLRIDETQPLFSDEARQSVRQHLRDATDRFVATQHADGYWDSQWPGLEPDGPQSGSPGPLGPLADRLLATGHTLEWWSIAPPDLLPPDDTIARAVNWICPAILNLPDSDARRFYPFLTHAGRALSQWRGVPASAAWERLNGESAAVGP